jgi:hypothetical protein
MILTEDTFFVYAANHYKNPTCTGIEDFEGDLARFKYIKRLLNRPELAHRLILNHIILLHNVFGEQVVNLLFFKIERKHWSQIKTFLVFLNYINSEFEITTPLDFKLVSILRTI